MRNTLIIQLQKVLGKVPVERAMALYHFHKSGRIQHLMHALKYKGRKDVGLRLGNLLGYQIKQFHLFPDIDFITAVPLHKDKEKNADIIKVLLLAKD